jgi:putative endopeptidase
MAGPTKEREKHEPRAFPGACFCALIGPAMPKPARCVDAALTLLPMLMLAFAAACQCSPAAAAPAPAAAAPAPAAAEPLSPSGVSVSAMEPQVDPCVDFYRYACGGWVAKHPVPPDRPTWSRFAEVAERNRTIEREILEADAAGGAARSAEQRKLGDFYAGCMDEAGVEARGLAPIQPELDRIAALESNAGLAALVAQLRKRGVSALLGFRAGQDYKDAAAMIAVVDAGGLALPDRDYYLKNDEKSAAQRKQYADHVERMLVLSGEPAERAAADAAGVVALETALAKASLDRVSRRDPYKLYHRVTRRELAAATPAFSWDAFLAGIGAPPVESLNLSEPEFLKAVDELVRTAPVEQWRGYLRWHLLHSTAQWLPRRFAGEDFAFYGKTLGGAQEQRPRWERCVEAADRALGDALGKEFVARAFDPGAKQRTLAMVGEIEKAMARDIASLPWMGEETRKQAQAKLAAIANKIAYPDVWRDYSRLDVVHGDLLGNVERAAALELERRLAKIGKPVDRRDWNMTPPTVNAYYSSAMNDINFPAGILQLPFYDPRRDDAVNYGGIGAVIGHEMTHGFDDQGRQFGPTGNLEDWWTPGDAAEFKRRAACLADEYSAFPAAGGLKVNGRLTLGENVADNGGLRLAYMAFEDGKGGQAGSTLAGFSPEQRFFLGFAQVWCGNTTAEAERLQVLTNPHSPGRYRVAGVVSNFPEFQQAFHCPAGAPMAPASRCRVW